MLLVAVAVAPDWLPGKVAQTQQEQGPWAEASLK